MPFEENNTPQPTEYKVFYLSIYIRLTKANMGKLRQRRIAVYFMDILDSA